MGSSVGEELLARLREKNPRYTDITGRELAEGCRDLAIEQFGPMARTVLEHWGVHSTEDMGAIVYALIDCGVLIKQETDSREDFRDVYDFEEAFERDYPWGKLEPHS